MFVARLVAAGVPTPATGYTYPADVLTTVAGRFDARPVYLAEQLTRAVGEASDWAFREGALYATLVLYHARALADLRAGRKVARPDWLCRTGPDRTVQSVVDIRCVVLREPLPGET
jgi:hypothetical protein